MRILILSQEAWRDDENGGNVLSNIFKGFNAEFAQIYCTDAEPSNNICKLYYQLTDKMMLDSIVKFKDAGLIKEYENYPKYTKPYVQYGYGIKKIHWYGIRLIRELLWKFGRWKNCNLKNFVLGFNPDVIFAPCYSFHYMMRLTEIVKSIYGVPVISYISDDFYTNVQISYDPLFWINHIFIRRHVRKVFRLYDLVYTMTDEQKAQCERDLHANMKILRKSGVFDKSKEKQVVNTPIRFVYAGGLYLNRWKTLSVLADAIRSVNRDKTEAVLDIYTRGEISPEIKSKLDDGITSTIHPPVSMDELMDIYAKSDVALHVESFDKKYVHNVRLSFSTKIVDCMDSGCAVMAICDEKQAGFAYLKRNDAAICVSSLERIQSTLDELVKNRSIIIEYQHKAFELGRKNHLEEITRQMLVQDFETIVGHE